MTSIVTANISPFHVAITWLLCANLALSTKPEVHDNMTISPETRPQTACIDNLTNFGNRVLKMLRTDIQTKTGR